MVSLIAGIVLALIGSTLFSKMRAYTNGSWSARQGRLILAEIEAFEKTNGKAPDQVWFASLGEMTKTNEGFRWVYFTPPMALGNERELVILTATKYGTSYLCGFSDGAVFFTDINPLPPQQELSEKLEKPW